MKRKGKSLLFVVMALIVLLSTPSWLTVATPAPRLLAAIYPLQATNGIPAAAAVRPNSTTTIYAAADATVQSGEANATDADNLYLGAGYYQTISPPGLWETGPVRFYLRFDLSSIPADSTIISATLTLRQAGGGDYWVDRQRPTTFYRVSGAWDEAGVTWNTKPGYAEEVGHVSTTYVPQDGVSMDVTEQVRQWTDGSEANHGLVAIGPEGPFYPNDVYRAFASSESGQGPRLAIHYQPALPPTLPPVLDVWPGQLEVKAYPGQATTTARLNIASVTASPLVWTATRVSSAPWLALDKSSGSASAAAPDIMILTFSGSGLAPGTYTEQVRISSATPGVVGSPLDVTISFQVIDGPPAIYLPMTVRDWDGDGTKQQPDIAVLIVAIAEYQFATPSATGVVPEYLPGGNLVAPGFDGDDFQAVVQAKLGALPDQTIRLGDTESACGTGLADTTCYPRATRANIIDAFAELDRKESENTLVLVYYSGHGGQVLDDNGDESDGRDEFVAAYDSDIGGPRGFTNVITDDDLASLLDNLESRHVVVVLDSCYSGGMVERTAQAPSQILRRGLKNPLITDAPSEQDALLDIAAPGRLIISSGTADQATYESGELQNGVFTYYFDAGLQDAANDANGNGIISFEEAFWHTKDLVDPWVTSHITPTPEDPDPHQNPDICDDLYGQVEPR